MVSWARGSSVGKAKVKHTSKADKELVKYFTSSTEVASHLQDSRALSSTMVASDDKCFSQLGTAATAGSPLSLLHTSSLPPVRGVQWAENTLTVQALLTVTKAVCIINTAFSTNPNHSPRYHILWQTVILLQKNSIHSSFFFRCIHWIMVFNIKLVFVH